MNNGPSVVCIIINSRMLGNSDVFACNLFSLDLKCVFCKRQGERGCVSFLFELLSTSKSGEPGKKEEDEYRSPRAEKGQQERSHEKASAARFWGSLSSLPMSNER